MEECGATGFNECNTPRETCPCDGFKQCPGNDDPVSGWPPFTAPECQECFTYVCAETTGPDRVGCFMVPNVFGGAEQTEEECRAKCLPTKTDNPLP